MAPTIGFPEPMDFEENKCKIPSSANCSNPFLNPFKDKVSVQDRVAKISGAKTGSGLKSGALPAERISPI